MEEDFHQADHAGVVEFDARDSRAALGDGQRQPLKEREIDMDVEEIGLSRRQAVGDGHERVPECGEIVEALVQSQVFQAVDADLDAEKGPELFVHASDEILAVDAQHMVAVVEFFEHRVQLAAEAAVFAHAEDLGDDVGRQAEHPQLTRALEDLVDGKASAKDEITTVFDLVERVGAPQVDRGPVLLREFGSRTSVQ